MAITKFQKRKILAKLYLSNHLFDLYIKSNKLDDYQRLLQYFPDGGFFLLKEMVDYLSDLSPKKKDNSSFDEDTYLQSNKTLFFNKGRLTTLKTSGEKIKDVKEVKDLNGLAEHLAKEKKDLKYLIADQLLKSLCYQDVAPDTYTDIDLEPGEVKDDFVSLDMFFIVDTKFLESVYDILDIKNTTKYLEVIKDLLAKQPVMGRVLTLLK